MKKIIVTGLLAVNAILGVSVYHTANKIIEQESSKNFENSKFEKILETPKIKKIIAWEDDTKWSRKYNKKIGNSKDRFEYEKEIPNFKKVWTSWSQKSHISREKLLEITDVVLRRMPHIRNCEKVKNLIVETAIAESAGGYHTDSSGGDYGVFQIRINTVKSLYNWLNVAHQDVLKILKSFENDKLTIAENLATNIPYSIAVCITEYWYKAGPDFISHIDTVKDRAIMWKSVYNTRLGKGTVNAYIQREKDYDKRVEKFLAKQEKRLAKKSS